MDLHLLFTNHIVVGAITGTLSAAGVDYHMFLTWKSFSDVANYNWSTAFFRWFQGAIYGAVTAAGLGALTGPA